MGVCGNICLYCCCQIVTLGLSCLTRITHSTQELLNTIWFRVALITLERFGRWPNYTTGQLNLVMNPSHMQIGLGEEIRVTIETEV